MSYWESARAENDRPDDPKRFLLMAKEGASKKVISNKLVEGLGWFWMESAIGSRINLAELTPAAVQLVLSEGRAAYASQVGCSPPDDTPRTGIGGQEPIAASTQKGIIPARVHSARWRSCHSS